MSPPTKVYVILLDSNGQAVAWRYLEPDRLATWLAQQAGIDGARCDVYEDAPNRGGRRLRTLERAPHGGWVERGEETA